MNDEIIEEGIALTSEDEFWMCKMREMTANAVKSVEEAAKQLIAMITLIGGIYGAVLAFSGIKEIPKGSLWAVLFYASPILLWLVSLFFALRVFKTQTYHYYSNSPDSAEAMFKNIRDFKYRNLNWSHFFVCVSFLVVAVGIMHWLYCGGPG